MTILEEARRRVQPVSPRYARYDARVRFFSRVLAFLRRHRILVIAVSCALLAAFILFLTQTGSFFTEARCDDFVYGDAPACNAQAFLAPTHYEYAQLGDSTQWQKILPTAPGQYRIRGVSKNIFGVEKYSNEMTFTLLPRELRQELPKENIRYGDMNQAILSEHTQYVGLASGDRIEAVRWDITVTDGPAAQVALKDIQICDTQGRDVTACYRIEAPEETIPLLPRPIIVRTDSFSKDYDGIPYHPTYKITSGDLAEGDTLEVQMDTPPVDAGEYSLPLSCIIRDSTGRDISHYYQITAQAGKLSVKPRPITIKTGSAEKVYDGKMLQCNEWSLISGSVLDSHTLEVTCPNKYDTVITIQNEPVIKIWDGFGSDMLHNYNVNVEYGTLTIHPIVLKFETDSGEKMYDGTALTAPGYRLVEGKLLPGHILTAYTSALTLAGSCPNALSVTIHDESGRIYTTEGYKIEVNAGTLTVTRRPITFTSRSAEKPYDGFPLTCPEFDVTSGSLCSMEGVHMYDFKGSQTRVGSSQNTFSILKITSGRLGGEDVTACYDITYAFGTLTVLPNPDYVPPENNPNGNGGNGNGEHPNGGGDTEGGGDIEGGGGGGEGGEGGNGGGSGGTTGLPTPGQGTSLGFPSAGNNTVYATVDCPDIGFGIQNVYFRNSSFGNYTGAGWTAPKLYDAKLFMPLMMPGYGVFTKFGGYPIYIRLKENCPVLYPYYSYMHFDVISGADQNRNDCYFTTLVGDSSFYDVVCLPNPDLADLQALSYFNLYAEYELVYRDYVYETYLDVPESTRSALLKWAAEQGIDPNSPTLITDIQEAVQNAAYYNLHAKDYPPNVDVAVYFLTVAKEGICQHFATAATLLYRCFGIPARYTTGFMTTVTGGTKTDIVGDDAHAWVEIYEDGLGWIYREVTGSRTSYDLVFQAASATKEYDGRPFQPHQLQQHILKMGSLRPGDRFEATYSVTNSIYPGTYENAITSYRIVNENGQDVTNTYSSIQVLPGALEITKRRITIVSGSATKVDDGIPLTCGDYWIAQGSLAEGDRLEVNLPMSMLFPATAQNTIKDVRILRKDPLNIFGERNIAYECYSITLVHGSLTVLKADPE